MNSFWYNFKIVPFTSFSIFSRSTLHVTCYNIHRRKTQKGLSATSSIFIYLNNNKIQRCLSSPIFNNEMLQNVFAFSVFQISRSTWSLPLWDKLKSKERFYDMSTADIQQKIELRTGSMSWTPRPLCHPHCNNCGMCSLFSPLPAVPRSRIWELSFRSRRLSLWGPLSWSLVLQLVPPQQASSETETKRSPSKLQSLSLQTFFPTLWAPCSNRILRDADRSRFTHPTIAAGLLRSIYLERPTCSSQVSEHCLSPAECNCYSAVACCSHIGD